MEYVAYGLLVKPGLLICLFVTQTFYALSATALNHPAFEAGTRLELKVPTFHPVRLVFTFWKRFLTQVCGELQERLTQSVAGKVMQFSKPQHGVIHSYGLPRNLLLEVCR